MQGHRTANAGEAGGDQAPATIFGGCDVCQAVQEADHRIANHLALLAGFVRLKAADLSRRPSDLGGEEVQLVMNAISSQIIAVGRLHRALAREGNPFADLGEHLHDISASLSALCADVEILEDFTDNCRVLPDQILPLTQIASEVLVNAVKYAHPVAARTVISARCFRDDAGRIRMEIADNGAGLPEAFNPERDGGLGFCLLRSFAKQLRAYIEFESSSAGLCFRLILPPQRRIDPIHP